MLEVEAKGRIRDPKGTRERILEMGGRYLRTEVQRDTYLRHPHRDFAETDEALRIRKVGDRYYLTYKGPKIDRLTKTRREIEAGLLDPKNAEEILHRLGFEEVLTIEKEREIFSLGDYIVMVDGVKGLGYFIEIEKHGEDYDPGEIIDILREIGVEEIERRSYLELMLEKS